MQSWYLFSGEPKLTHIHIYTHIKYQRKLGKKTEKFTINLDIRQKINK